MNTTTVKKNTKGRGRVGVPSGLTEQQRRLYARIPERIEYVDNAAFKGAAKDMEERLFGEGAAIEVPAWTHFAEVPEDVASVRARRVALKGQQERTLFLQYNYARYRLSRLLSRRPGGRTAREAGEMVLWFERAMKCRAAVARANMALVLAMAKRARIGNVDFGELVSEGNMALLRSIEKFDVGRGFKFSTYACRAIIKSFNRLATKTGRYRSRFPREFDPSLERSDYDEKRHEMQQADSLDALDEVLALNRAELSDVERRIVAERFALGNGGKRRTLTEVGRGVGLTNERVRQLQKAALAKIRAALDKEYLVA